MSNSALRNLIYLEDTASTARVLNLLRVYRRRNGRDPEHTTNPFFKNPRLNSAIILKHRLRRHEKELFGDGRKTATKVILAIDREDLKFGGRSVFVGQSNYDAIMEAALGEKWRTDSSDSDLLKILDGQPSLDPFLLREGLRRHDREPARCYFEISDADLARMHAFVRQEVQKLINLCYSGGTGESAEGGHAARLVDKILSNAVDAETEPLRLTLRLEKPEYQEGVFCWKGFLYYKWNLAECMPEVARVSQAITTLKPVDPLDAATRAYLQQVRDQLIRSIGRAIDAANTSLASYEAAFNGLLDGKPLAFREFLLNAPSMFYDLGERLGAISHIVSFWSYRFPKSQRPLIYGAELCDIFADFEASLAFNELPMPALA